MAANHPIRLLFAGPMMGCHAGWVPSPAEDLSSRLITRGYSCLLTSSVLHRYKRALDICATVVRKRKEYDILSLQVYSGPSFLVEEIVSFLAQRLNKPIVMVLHGGSMPDFFAKYPGWAKRVLQRAGALVAPSTYLAMMLERYGFTSDVIPNAIDKTLYPYRHRSHVCPRLLWMRTFHEIYNPKMAVETLAQLTHDFPEATLTMAGQEKGVLAATQAFARQLGVEARTRFAGYLDIRAKQTEFAGHDIFLNTNRIDNMPVSLLEAAAFGMPIVATCVGGVPYMIRDGENGLLVPNEDATAMARAVRRLVEEPGLAGCLSGNARLFAESHDWSALLPMWESLFQKVMDQTV